MAADHASGRVTSTCTVSCQHADAGCLRISRAPIPSRHLPESIFMERPLPFRRSFLVQILKLGPVKHLQTSSVLNVYHESLRRARPDVLRWKGPGTNFARIYFANRNLLHRNVQRFRGGLVFKAHRLLYHSTLSLRVIKKKKKTATCAAFLASRLPRSKSTATQVDRGSTFAPRRLTHDVCQKAALDFWSARGLARRRCLCRSSFTLSPLWTP